MNNSQDALISIVGLILIIIGFSLGNFIIFWFDLVTLFKFELLAKWNCLLGVDEESYF